MSDQSQISMLGILGLDPSTPSPGSEDGPTRSGSPDGQTTSRSGLEAAPAPHLAPREKAQSALAAAASALSRILSSQPDGSVSIVAMNGAVTTATSSPSSSASSLSTALQSSLGNRLQARLAGCGSPLYALSWKSWDMPSGPPICALRASARRTSDSGFFSERSGWPTPRTRDWKGATENTLTRRDGKKRHDLLDHAALLAGWPTPMAGTPAQNGNNEAGNTDSSRKTVALAGWPTPCEQDGPKGGPAQGTDRLPGAAQTCGPARLTARGEMLTGSTAGMASGGRLNPAFSRWLMGYPPAWDDCAATAMPSFRNSRRRSS